MDIRILLITQDDGERVFYREAISNLGVEVKAVAWLKGLDADITEAYYHGVIIDMATKIQGLKNNREFIYRTLRKFPVAHVNRKKKSPKISVFYPGQHPGATLRDFIQDKCVPFTPRKLGAHIRKELHFNVVLFKSNPPQEEAAERTVTVDVSENGCFLFSVQSWKPGDTGWIIIQELDDRTPIQCLVRRHVPWGAGMRIPGIGLTFTHIKDKQKKHIVDRLWN